MKTPILTILVCLCLIASVSAHIGETKEQCDIRYGSPTQTKEDGSVAWYEKNGLEIAVTFYQGKADSVVYSHKQKDPMGWKDKFSLNEVQILQAANSPGSWTLQDENSYVWNSPDSSMGCQYFPFKKERPLVIATSEKLHRNEQKTQAKEAESLKGM
jgi:hypothetical protein